jgi:hypothetical protein
MRLADLLPLAALAASCLANANVQAQDQPAKPAAKAAWPKLDRLQADRVEQLLQNFKLDNPELHEKSLDELVALGPGAAPLLIARLSDAKSNLNAKISSVLDQVTAKEHADLIAEETKAKVAARRRWSVGRLVEVRADDMAALYGKALTDKDDETAYRAAVGLASLGDAKGMDKVFARVVADWKGAQPWLEKTLPPGRSEAVSTWLIGKLGSETFADKVAALRLFRSLGVRAHAIKVVPALDSSDHGIKKEAINALRVVVLDEPALDDLSVFQAIEMAKQIKSKL